MDNRSFTTIDPTIDHAFGIRLNEKMIILYLPNEEAKALSDMIDDYLDVKASMDGVKIRPIEHAVNTIMTHEIDPLFEGIETQT